MCLFISFIFLGILLFPVSSAVSRRGVESPYVFMQEGHVKRGCGSNRLGYSIRCYSFVIFHYHTSYVLPKPSFMLGQQRSRISQASPVWSQSLPPPSTSMPRPVSWHKTLRVARMALSELSQPPFSYRIVSSAVGRDCYSSFHSRHRQCRGGLRCPPLVPKAGCGGRA
jgi:hypothetical protein